MSTETKIEMPIPASDIQILSEAVDDAVQILTDGFADPAMLNKIGMSFLEASIQMQVTK